MDTQLTNLLSALKLGAKTFKDVIAHIETEYTHQPTAFKNASDASRRPW